MKTRTRRTLIAAVIGLAVLAGPSIVLAAFHGAAATKSTVSPVKIGDPYTSSAQFLNVADTALDTLRINGLSDVVHSAGGNVSSGNILATVGLIFGGTGTVTCTGGSGAGTVGDPYTGATSCLVAALGTVTTTPFSHYTVQAADFGLPNNRLTDTVTWNWNDTCDVNPDNDCTTDPQTQTAGASALILQLGSTTATEIHNAAHATVTTIAVGTTVHDFATVTGQPGSPTPTGNVVFRWYSGTLGDECDVLLQTSGSFALDGSGEADATSFNFTPNAAGFRGFRAEYLGDATYTGSIGACEPLRVVDARISITPNDTNEIGNAHTFTATVWVNNGTGETLAPADTLVTFTSVDSDGAVSTPNPPTQCMTVGATGSCTTTINSNATGTTTVTAHTTVTVSGVALTRDTNNQASNSGPASKTWVDARIAITPNDTNEVGNSHTFTATVWVDPGDGEVPAPNGTLVTFTSVNTDGAVSTPNPPASCMTSGGTGTCTTVINSNATGTTTVTAHTTVTVGGVPLTRSTDSSLQNSGPASKTWVDASIGITPDGNNPVGALHTFTVLVQKDPGAGLVAAAGETVSTSIVNSLGATATMVGGTCGNTSGTTGGGFTDVSGQCTVVITSPTAGTTKAFASVSLVVGGVTLIRDSNSGTAGVVHGPGGTDEATKTWFAPPTPTPTEPDTAATGPAPVDSGPASQGNLILLLILGAIVAAVLLIRPGLRPVTVPGTAGSRNSRSSRTQESEAGTRRRRFH